MWLNLECSYFSEWELECSYFSVWLSLECSYFSVLLSLECSYCSYFSVWLSLECSYYSVWLTLEYSYNSVWQLSHTCGWNARYVYTQEDISVVCFFFSSLYSHKTCALFACNIIQMLSLGFIQWSRAFMFYRSSEAVDFWKWRVGVQNAIVSFINSDYHFVSDFDVLYFQDRFYSWNSVHSMF